MPAQPAKKPTGRRIKDGLINLSLRSLIGLALAIPYRARVRLMGWLTSRVISPLAGWEKRIRTNIEFVWPDMPEDQIKQLIRDVPDNAGRTMIEIYSGQEFADHIKDTVTPRGPGLAALDTAREAGEPVILISGHFGNYHAFQSTIHQRGNPVGALYRDMDNAQFNAHYVAAMETIAKPMFPRGRRGLAQMVKFLRSGNTIALLSDQYNQHGPSLRFFGKLAPSAISTAEMALKYNAKLFPIYGVRQSDGIGFDVIVEEPIPHSDAETMMQAAADSLEAQVRLHPGQWLWSHQRWKPEYAGVDSRNNRLE